MKKSHIRSKILQIRLKFSKKNKKIKTKNLINIIKKKSTNKKIGLYYPINSEVSTLDLINDLNDLKFVVLLPVIKKNFQMLFYKWDKNYPLKINNIGIPEPIKSKIMTPSTIIIPIVAFDKELNRLGYGSGFYDRYIQKAEKKKKLLKIGLALSCQKINKVPINRFDRKMDYIFTEDKIYS